MILSIISPYSDKPYYELKLGTAFAFWVVWQFKTATYLTQVAMNQMMSPFQL